MFGVRSSWKKYQRKLGLVEMAKYTRRYTPCASDNETQLDANRRCRHY